MSHFAGWKQTKVLPPKILAMLPASERKKMGKDGEVPAEIDARTTAKLEKELQRQIVQYLRLNGIEPCWHRTDKRSTATVGWPDLTFAVRGIPIAWEVKLPTGRLSREQEMMAEKLQSPENGWKYSVIKSFDQARQYLKELGV